MISETARSKLSPHLLFPDRDFNMDQSLPVNTSEIIEDLGLDIIIKSMAKGDKRINDVVENVLLHCTTEISEIEYRQEVLKDALKNRIVVRGIFSSLTHAIEKAKKNLFWLGSTNIEYSLHESINILEFYLTTLENLRSIAEANHNTFNSEGFKNLFNQFINEFNYEYIAAVKEHLEKLKFPNGVKILGRLGKNIEPTDFSLVVPDMKRGIGSSITKIKDRKYTYILAERDEAGYRELGNIKTKSLIRVSTALRYASDNLLNFVNTLTNEIAFLVGCINLAEDIERMGGSVTFPVPKPSGDSALSFSGLYDMALFIRLNGAVVTNDLPPGNQRLTIVSGANRGGKSTFLRSIGQSLFMMQAGMFVGGKEFSSSVFYSIHTHFKREEEKEMTKGKFDEELERISKIVDRLRRGSIVLFNESFAATNAVEGSQIAGQIIIGLIENGVTVIYVTHLYELAQMFTNKSSEDVRFLVAERLGDGQRTYRIIQGRPSATSYGEDLYRRIFEPE